MQLEEGAAHLVAVHAVAVAAPGRQPMQLHAGRCAHAHSQLLGGIGRSGRRLDHARDLFEILKRHKRASQDAAKVKRGKCVSYGGEWPPFHGQILVLILFRKKPARAHMHVISGGGGLSDG